MNRRSDSNRQNAGPKWFNSPLSIFEDRTLVEIQSLIPEFERRPGLAMSGANNENVKVNNRLHTIGC